MGPSAQELMTVRKRILGVLLRDARENGGHTPEECAELLGIPLDEYARFESGDHTPTLPHLEILAYTFNVPIKHFLGSATLAEQEKTRDVKERVPELTMIRQKVIGLKLRQMREKAALSQAEVGEKVGLSAGQIDVVERGMLSLPITMLERVARTVQGGIEDFMDGHGTVGNWLQAQEQFDAFAELGPELRSFVVRPINRSYLELAMRLSEMEVNRLRQIAESILEITY